MYKFKKGQWVRYKTHNEWKIGKVNHIGPRGYGELWGEAEDIIVNIEEERDYFFDDSGDIQPWEPEPGELCIFWDTGDEVFTIAPYGFCNYGTEAQIDYISSDFDNVAPFTGTLPTILKD